MNKNHQLPDGWNWVTAEQLADGSKYALKAGPFGSSLKKEFYVPKGYKVYGQEQVIRGDATYGDYYIDEEKFQQLKTNAVKPGDILISLVGTIGKVLILPENIEPGIINPRLVKLSLDKNRINTKFFKYYFATRSAREYFSTVSHGQTMEILNLSILKNLPIPLPPLSEQERIVAKIEGLFTQLEAGMSALERVQAGLRRYKASVLKAAVSGKLVNGNSGIGERELSQGWRWVTVEEIGALDVGFAFKSNEFTDNGIRLLRGDNIEPGALRWIDTRYWIEEKLEPYKHLLINEGDIILAMDRPLITAGLKIARAKPSDLPCLLVQRVARFKPHNPEMNDYLHIALQTQEFIKHLFGKQTGTQLPHISGKTILSYRFPLPPLEDQRRIVAEVERRLSVARQVESTVEEALVRASRLRQAVLRSAFEGRL